MKTSDVLKATEKAKQKAWISLQDQGIASLALIISEALSFYVEKKQITSLFPLINKDEEQNIFRHLGG